MCKSSYTLISFVLLLHVDLNLLAHARVYLQCSVHLLALLVNIKIAHIHGSFWCSGFKPGIALNCCFKEVENSSSNGIAELGGDNGEIYTCMHAPHEGC